MTERIRGLDGLRAVAVGLVLVMHKTEFGTSTRVGFYGVWLFFLLSGYLITGQLQAARQRMDRDGSTALKELLSFWFRRAFRIFPAYYAVLASISLYYLLIGKEVHGLIFYVVHLSNFYLATNMEQFHTTWAHFWSLAVEEQFYLLFAPLLLFAPATRALKICIALVVASLIQRTALTAAGTDPFRIYIDSLVNFGLLAGGGVLFLLAGPVKAAMIRFGFDRGRAGWIACCIYLLIAIASTHYLHEMPWLLQASYVFAACIGIFIVANVISSQSNSLVDCLEWPTLAFIGRLSYSIYLINDYVPADIPMRIMTRLLRPSVLADVLTDLNIWALSFLGTMLSVALTLVGAYVSWLCIEKPALDLRNRISTGSKRSHVAIVSFESPVARHAAKATEV